MRDKLSALFVTLLVPVAALAVQSGSVATERIFDAIGVKEGITVCEIGAGNGAMTIAAATRVGAAGRVYTNELGERRVKALQEKVADSRLLQITVVAGAETSTNLPDAACDAVFLHNVYHHFTDPAAMNASIAAALKPGGRVAVVDFTPPDKEAARPADRGKDGMHGIRPETLSRELQEAGFEPVATEAGAQRWFMVVVGKPAR